MAEQQKANEGLSESQQRAAYELFKFLWMIDHGYTISGLMADMMRYTASLWDGSKLTEDEIAEECQNWENDIGFGGSIWPCFDEFLDMDLKYLDLTLPENKKYISIVGAAINRSLANPQEEGVSQ